MTMKHSVQLLVIILTVFIVVLSACNTQDEGRRFACIIAEADSMNRNYVSLSTLDSLLLAACNYYDRHGTPNEKMRAHYILGCVYRDKGEAPQAIECYQDALAAADTTARDCNFRQMMSIYGQMAELYHSQNLPSSEIVSRQSASYYAEKAGDTFGAIRSYETLTKPYYILGDTAKVLDVIRKSQALYRKYGFAQEVYNSYNTLIFICIQQGRLSEARKLMQEFESYSGYFDSQGHIESGRELYYYSKGKFFLLCHQPDSAICYFKMLPAQCQADSYRGLLLVYKQKGNPDSVYKYARLYEQAIDTLHNSMRTHAIQQTTSFYNYHRYQHEAEAAKIAAVNDRLFYQSLLALIAFVLFVLFILYRSILQHKQQENVRLSANYDRVLTEYAQLEAELAKQTADSMEQLQAKRNDIATLQAQIDRYEPLFRKMKKREKKEALINSDILNTFREKAKWKRGQLLPTGNEWDTLQRQLALSMPQFYTFISPLSQKEQQACMLFSLSFTNSAIAILLGVHEQRVSNIKASINEKLFGEKTATTLENNLKRIMKKLDL